MKKKYLLLVSVALGSYFEADGDEYLSEFMKQDRPLPIVTPVVHFDSKEWDGPIMRST